MNLIVGERFVPGQIIDTEFGPRFVPGKVLEVNGEVEFVPAQIVQTDKGVLKFILSIIKFFPMKKETIRLDLKSI